VNELETENTEELSEEIEAPDSSSAAAAEGIAAGEAETAEEQGAESADVTAPEAEETDKDPEADPSERSETVQEGDAAAKAGGESAEGADAAAEEETTAASADALAGALEAAETPPEPEDPLAEAAAALQQEAEVEEGGAVLEEAAEEDVASAEEAEEDERQWYVVHCYSGYENKVQHNLEQRIETMGMKDRIFDIVVPTEEEMEVKEGKRRTVERRVFPGYILVQMIMDEDSWYVVRNTPGVTGFVGMGNEPTPLRPEEVSQIIKRMEAEAPRIKVTYKLGQKVRIIDGPFNDFIGTVDDIDMERAKVRVMVSFFGRETPVELDFLQVEKA
jgi:transcriptional antiterminator NusG